VHKLLTPKIIFSEIVKRIFERGALAGFVVGQVIALPPKFASLAADKKVIYQSKRGVFLWGYV